MKICHNPIKEGESEVDNILVYFTSKLQLRDVGVEVNIALKTLQQKFLRSSCLVTHRLECKRKDIVQWTQTGWEEVEERTI